MSARLCRAAVAAAVLCAACQSSGPTKEEIDAAKSTLDCDHAGDRILIRFADGEARMLMPDGTRIILYQVAMASGMRYTNGLIELRGRGMDLELSRERQTVRMACKQYELPPKKD
jgi:membrane-bound inhibitor of C-type lysozyme